MSYEMAWARGRRSARTEHGTPCAICGSTERYQRGYTSGGCADCKRRRNKRKNDMLHALKHAEKINEQQPEKTSER